MRHENKALVRALAALACEMCGAHSNNAAHHIVTRARMGGDYPWNLMTLCFRCHREWHDKGLGWMLKKWSHLLGRLHFRGFQYDENSGKLFRSHDIGEQE